MAVVKKRVATKENMAVAVAKDVLKRLNKYNVTTDTYLFAGAHSDMYFKELLEAKKTTKSSDLSRFLPKIEKTCSVCAMGATFLSAVRLYDNFDIRKNQCRVTPSMFSVDGRTMKARLASVFSQRDLALIEAAFMGCIINVDVSSFCSDDEEVEGEKGKVKINYIKHIADTYYTTYVDDKTRLKTIMTNVVRNKGIFVPEQDLKPISQC